MQFVYIVSHSKQQYFCGYLFTPSEQKLSKTIILLYDSECSLELD